MFILYTGLSDALNLMCTSLRMNNEELMFPIHEKYVKKVQFNLGKKEDMDIITPFWI